MMNATKLESVLWCVRIRHNVSFFFFLQSLENSVAVYNFSVRWRGFPSTAILTFYAAQMIRNLFSCWASCTGCSNFITLRFQPKWFHFFIFIYISYSFLPEPFVCTEQVTLFHPPPPGLSVFVTNKVIALDGSQRQSSQLRRWRNRLLYSGKKGPVIAWSEICVSWHGRLAKLQ